jgi:hypothetical protein
MMLLLALLSFCPSPAVAEKGSCNQSSTIKFVKRTKHKEYEGERHAQTYIPGTTVFKYPTDTDTTGVHTDKVVEAIGTIEETKKSDDDWDGVQLPQNVCHDGYTFDPNNRIKARCLKNHEGELHWEVQLLGQCEKKKNHGNSKPLFV